MSNRIPTCNKCASARLRDENDSDKRQTGVIFITPEGPNKKLEGCDRNSAITNSEDAKTMCPLLSA